MTAPPTPDPPPHGNVQTWPVLVAVLLLSVLIVTTALSAQKSGVHWIATASALGLALTVACVTRSHYQSAQASKRLQAELVSLQVLTEASRREMESLWQALDQHLIVSITDRHGRITEVNSGFCTISGYSRDELIGQDHRLINSGVHPKSFWVDVWRELAAGRAWRGEVCNRRKDGTQYWVDSTIIPFRDEAGRVQKYVSLRLDITNRKSAESDRDRLNVQLGLAARQAGMAEVATGVLHNVGNVLNSVNVSATVVAEKLKESRLRGLARVAEMIRQHDGDVGAFMQDDERGQLIPAYLTQLATTLAKENEQLQSEAELLLRSVDHIKHVIESQQRMARRSLDSEPIDLAHAVDEAIRIKRYALEQRRVEVVRAFEAAPSAFAEKHVVIQILINFISNAINAMLRQPGDWPRRVLFVIRPDLLEGREAVSVCVVDTGIGIGADDLPHVFQHGFSRCEGGHGFGLHTAAIDAQRMGGAIRVHSDGIGTGATFTLTIPAARKDEPICPALT